jgi:hypothetical protein
MRDSNSIIKDVIADYCQPVNLAVQFTNDLVRRLESADHIDIPPIVIVEPENFFDQSWSFVYRVQLGPVSPLFLVNASEMCEALDMIADWCKQHEQYLGLFLDPVEDAVDIAALDQHGEILLLGNDDLPYHDNGDIYCEPLVRFEIHGAVTRLKSRDIL